MIVSKQVALEQGSTPGFLRTVANSIERLSRRTDAPKDSLANAKALRRLAVEIQRDQRG